MVMFYLKLFMFVIILIMYPFIILAAGNSTRMGEPKPFVKLYNNQTLLEYLIDELKKCEVTNIFVVLNNEGKQILENHYAYLMQEATIIINNFLEKGRIYSLKLGLKKINKTSVFIQNVDNPFINKKIIFDMSNLLRPYTFVVPEFQKKGGHPILISHEIVDELIKENINVENLRVFLSRYQKISYVTEFQEILYNLNNSLDVEFFQKKIKKF